MVGADGAAWLVWKKSARPDQDHGDVSPNRHYGNHEGKGGGGAGCVYERARDREGAAHVVRQYQCALGSELRNISCMGATGCTALTS